MRNAFRFTATVDSDGCLVVHFSEETAALLAYRSNIHRSLAATFGAETAEIRVDGVLVGRQFSREHSHRATPEFSPPGCVWE